MTFDMSAGLRDREYAKFIEVQAGSLTAINTTGMFYDSGTQSIKSLIVDRDGEAVYGLNWNKQVSTTGSVGADVDVTPATSDKRLFEMIINAPLANDSATLTIYKDATSPASNLLFTGNVANRDADGSIKFPGGEVCTTKWIVTVTGGSGTVYLLARYN